MTGTKSLYSITDSNIHWINRSSSCWKLLSYFLSFKRDYSLTYIYAICLTTSKQSDYFVYNLKPQSLFRTEIWTRNKLHGKSNPHFWGWDTMQSGLQFVLCSVNENPKILAGEGTFYFLFKWCSIYMRIRLHK